MKKYYTPQTPKQNVYGYGSLIVEKNKPYTKPMKIKPPVITLTEAAQKIVDAAKPK